MSDPPTLPVMAAEVVRQLLVSTGFEVTYNPIEDDGNGVPTRYEFEVVREESPTVRVWVELDLTASTAYVRFGEQIDTAWVGHLADPDFEVKVRQYIHEWLGPHRPAASDQ